MKKLLFFLFIIFLFSCEKEKCKTCTTTVSGGGMSSKTTFEVCGSDLKSIDGKVITSTTSYGGVTVTVISRTNCQ
jgi:hypothetical protein